jgi:hypothetical protein
MVTTFRDQLKERLLSLLQNPDVLRARNLSTNLRIYSNISSAAVPDDLLVVRTGIANRVDEDREDLDKSDLE